MGSIKYITPFIKISGIRWARPNQLGNIGLVYRNQGKLEEAMKHLEQARSIFIEIGAKGEDLQTIENKIAELSQPTPKNPKE